MIGSNNDKFINLSPSEVGKDASTLEPIMVSGEEVIAEYTSTSTGAFVVFTNKRIIAVSMQGLTGTMKDFTTLPYSKIQAFSFQTRGFLDPGNVLEICLSGLVKADFGFTSSVDIREIGKFISEKIL